MSETQTAPVTQWREVMHIKRGVTLAAAGWMPEHPKAIVILSHGHREHLGRYGHVVNGLVGDGFAVYGQDHRGHGRSNGARALITDFDQVADDLHILATHARRRHPDIPMVLIGHSMGGLIALRYVLRYQDELTALVTSGPAVIINDGVSPVAETIGKAVARVAPMAPLPDGGDGGCGLSTDSFICEQYGIDHRTWHGDTRLGTVAAMLDVGEDTRERFCEIRVPLLAMHGAIDTVTYPRGTELLHAGASSEDKTIIMWPGRKHEIFNSPGRDIVIDTMRQWLAARV
ncbi:MAG: alpha/beta hydrolase [Chloroflexia bacterium]|nr:alpha/beta hydrolase [Chloroflexia bacterium]